MSSQPALDLGVADAAVVPPREGSLRRKALRATAWRMGLYISEQLVRIIANVLLAHLLFPGDFGLMTLASTILQGLSMFSELGIGPAVIQSSRGSDPVFLNTAWTLQVTRGCWLWIGASLLAWPASRFYHAPQLAWIVPVSSLMALLAGLNSTNVLTLNRQMIEGRRTILDFTQTVVARTSMILCAFTWHSVWALAVGSLVGQAVYTVGSHVFLPGERNRFCWDREAARALFHFGFWIFIGTIIAFFCQQVDRLALGRITTLGVLGVYGISMTVAKLPQEAVGVLAQHIVYPLLAALRRRDPETYAHKVLEARSLVLTSGVMCVLGVVVTAPWFFRCFYDTRYADAGWIAQLAAVGVWLSFLASVPRHSLLAGGYTRELAIASGANLVGMASGCLGGYALWHLPGFVLGTALGPLASHLVIQHCMRRRLTAIYRQDFAFTAMLASAVLLSVGLPMFVARLAQQEVSIAFQMVTSLLVLAGVAWWAMGRIIPALRQAKAVGENPGQAGAIAVSTVVGDGADS